MWFQTYSALTNVLSDRMLADVRCYLALIQLFTIRASVGCRLFVSSTVAGTRTGRDCHLRVPAEPMAATPELPCHSLRL